MFFLRLLHVLACRRVGVAPPGVEVRFKNVSVSCNVFVGARGMPGMGNDARSMAEVRAEGAGGLHIISLRGLTL